MAENNHNRGDDYYNREPSRYRWADEVGWIDNYTNKVVEADGSSRGIRDGEGDRWPKYNEWEAL